MLTKESYTRLLQDNLDPETTLVEVSYSRNVDALVRQVKDSGSTSSEISDVTTPVDGDQQQTRWQREESGHLFNYLNTYQYFEDRNWMDVYFSKTYVKTTVSAEANPVESIENDTVFKEAYYCTDCTDSSLEDYALEKPLEPICSLASSSEAISSEKQFVCSDTSKEVIIVNPLKEIAKKFKVEVDCQFGICSDLPNITEVPISAAEAETIARFNQFFQGVDDVVTSGIKVSADPSSFHSGGE